MSHRAVARTSSVYHWVEVPNIIFILFFSYDFTDTPWLEPVWIGPQRHRGKPRRGPPVHRDFVDLQA